MRLTNRLSIHSSAVVKVMEAARVLKTDFTATQVSKMKALEVTTTRDALNLLRQHKILTYRKFKGNGGTVKWGYKWTLVSDTLEQLQEACPRRGSKPKYEIKAESYFLGAPTPFDTWEKLSERRLPRHTSTEAKHLSAAR